METPEFAETEIVSSETDNTVAVPAINFKRNLGVTGLLYINLGQARKVQGDP